MVAAVLAGAVVTVAAAACGQASPQGGATPADAESTTASTRAPVAAAATPTTGPQAITSSASGWFAGSEITLKGASYDPVAGTIVVSAEARNTSNHDFVFGDDVFLDIGAVTPLPLGGATMPTALKLSSTDIGFTFRAPENAVDLAGATLQLGDVDQKRWLLPLAAGAKGTGTDPISSTVADTFTDTKIRFSISKVDVVSWTCAYTGVEGGRGWTEYAPVAKDRLGLIVWVSYSELADYRGGDAIDDGIRVTQPNGLTVAGVRGNSPVMSKGDRVDLHPWCFTIDEPARGAYTLEWKTYSSGSGTHRITVG